MKITLAGIIGLLSSVILGESPLSSSNTSLELKYDIVDNFGGSSTNFDLKGKEYNKIQKLNGAYHKDLGTLSFYGSNYEILSYEQFKTYQSGFFPDDNYYDDYLTRIDITYSFQKYLDLPMRIIDNRSVLAGQSNSYTIETIESKTETTSKTVENGYNFLNSYKRANSINIGGSLNLNLIKLEGNSKTKNEVVVQQEVYNMVSNTRSSSTTYSKKYTETFNFDNTLNDFSLYFQLNYRQKFKVFLTTTFFVNYKTSITYSGLWNKDEKYKYDFLSYNGYSNYFLIPVDVPYFEVTQYYDYSNGIKSIYNKNNSMIFYA